MGSALTPPGRVQGGQPLFLEPQDPFDACFDLLKVCEGKMPDCFSFFLYLLILSQETLQLCRVRFAR